MVDINRMTIRYIPIFLASCLHASLSSSEYLSLSSGYQYGQHGYLSDTGQLNTRLNGVKMDTSEWRREQTGWMARGASIEWQQGIDYTYFNGTIPIYHWHKLQGLWFEVKKQNQYLEVELSSDQTLLTNSGASTELSSGSQLSTEHTINQYSVYWYEAIQYKAPINIIGLFYYAEASPASSTITDSTATLFNGQFTGYGLTIGRIKDIRGLNFEWRLNLAQLDTSFSDSSTGHRAASAAESTAYKFGLDMNWHYRYYLAPYWYLVPYVKISINSLFQTQSTPSVIEFEALNYTEARSWISLQRRF